MTKIFLAAAVAISLLQYGCNDPTVIGSDLFNDQQLDIDFTDTVSLRAWTIEGDSVLTFSPIVSGTDTRSFLFGDMQDPVFGRVISTIYFQVSLNTVVPNFENAELDSIFLLLPYNANMSYGDIAAQFGMEVFLLDEQLHTDSFYYSNQSFKVRNASSGNHIFVPKPQDSLTIFEPSMDTTERYPAHLRVPLSANLGNFLLNTDPVNYSSDSLFYNMLPGFRLRPTITTPGMLSFDLRGFPAGLKIYYHQDTNHYEYTFPIFSYNVVTTHIQHDYTGSAVEPFLQKDQPKNDSIVFVQAASGTDIVVEIPWVQSLQNIIVNKAELEFKILRLPGDSEKYAHADQLLASQIIGDTAFILIDDVQFSLNRAGSNFGEIFGGKVLDGDIYRLNISAHLQEMIEGQRSNKMLITVYNKVQKASRAAIGGPTHSLYPMKLRLSFTRY